MAHHGKLGERVEKEHRSHKLVAAKQTRGSQTMLKEHDIEIKQKFQQYICESYIRNEDESESVRSE